MFKRIQFIRILALILCVTTTVIAFPISSGAQSGSDKSATEPVSSDFSIISEIIQYRDEYSKVYYKKDGTYTAISSGEALHYKDDIGKWQDIDNTLLLKKDKSGNDIVTNTANEFKAQFPTSLNSDNTVKMEKGQYSISFRLENIKKSKGNKINYKKLEIENNSKKQAKDLAKFEKKSSRMKYEDILDNTDIVYDVKSKQIKESIILKKAPQKAVSYTYEITAEGLVAKLLENNSIEFYSVESNQPEFIISAPFMYDSAKETAYSEDIIITLEDLSGGKYKMTYTPSIKWLQDKNRKYPVTVDPTVTTSKTSANVQDAYVFSYNPDTNYGSAPKLSISGLEYSTLIRFVSLPSIPTGGTVTKANMHVTPIGSSSQVPIAVNPITEMWDESTVTYNNRPETSNDMITSVSGDKLSSTPTTIYDLTRLVSDWYINGNNYGVMLRAVASSGGATYKSSETENPEEIPYLEIEFSCLAGLNSVNDLHAIDVGRAGMVYINDFTGQLMYKRHDMGFGGNIMPVDIDVIYDTSSKSFGYANFFIGIIQKPILPLSIR